VSVLQHSSVVFGEAIEGGIIDLVKLVTCWCCRYNAEDTKPKFRGNLVQEE